MAMAPTQQKSYTQQQEREERNSKIMRMLRSEDGRAFLSWVEEHCSQAAAQLKSVRDPVDMGRLQGNLDVLDRILRMKED